MVLDENINMVEIMIMGNVFYEIIKSVTEIATGVVTFTKTDLASIMQLLSLVSSTDDVHKLFTMMTLNGCSWTNQVSL
jgi:hypothetical protein